MKFSGECCCNFIDVDLFPFSYYIPRHLKVIPSHFYSSKIWWWDQNRRILKQGDHFCKMV